MVYLHMEKKNIYKYICHISLKLVLVVVAAAAAVVEVDLHLLYPQKTGQFNRCWLQHIRFCDDRTKHFFVWVN